MTFEELNEYLNQKNVTLVAVSKTKPVEEIQKLYDKGQRIFGENKVQEIVAKAPLLPDDISWHMIGHLQKNKVKQVLPYVSMIQSIDSIELLHEVNKEAIKINKVIEVLLEVKIATEDTKYGLTVEQVKEIITEYNDSKLPSIKICGLMGMASFSDDESLVRLEFHTLKVLFETLESSFIVHHSSLKVISMGMSGDYILAIEEGSNMVRIGSLLFGSR